MSAAETLSLQSGLTCGASLLGRAARSQRVCDRRRPGGWPPRPTSLLAVAAACLLSGLAGLARADSGQSPAPVAPGDTALAPNPAKPSADNADNADGPPPLMQLDSGDWTINPARPQPISPAVTAALVIAGVIALALTGLARRQAGAATAGRTRTQPRGRGVTIGPRISGYQLEGKWISTGPAEEEPALDPRRHVAPKRPRGHGRPGASSRRRPQASRPEAKAPAKPFAETSETRRMTDAQLVRQIADLVKADPAEAAAVLKQWIQQNHA